MQTLRTIIGNNGTDPLAFVFTSPLMTTVRPGPIEEFNLATNGRVCKETTSRHQEACRKGSPGTTVRRHVLTFKGHDPVKPQWSALPGSQQRLPENGSRDEMG